MTISALVHAAMEMTLIATALVAGLGKDGQLGYGGLSEYNPLPTIMTGSRTFSVISAGWSHTCGIANPVMPPPPQPPPPPPPPSPPNPPGIGAGCLRWELVSNKVSCSACRTCPAEESQCQLPEYYQKPGQDAAVYSCEPVDVSRCAATFWGCREQQLHPAAANAAHTFGGICVLGTGSSAVKHVHRMHALQDMAVAGEAPKSCDSSLGCIVNRINADNVQSPKLIFPLKEAPGGINLLNGEEGIATQC